MVGTATGIDIDGSSTTTPSDSTGADAEGSSSGEPSAVCGVVGIEGECQDVTFCAENDAVFQGLCSGGPANQCCVEAETACSHLGAPGLCLLDALCPEPFEVTPALWCGGAEVCCTDPLTRCGPSAMPLPNEGLVEESFDERCPDGMVHFEPIAGDSYCIDRFEASLVVVDDTGSVTSSWSPFHYPGATRVAAVSLRGAIPQGYISQLRATEACAEAGKYLCSADEWQAACRGPNLTDYPYGNTYQPLLCNEFRPVHPAIEYFGSDATWVFGELGHPCLNQLPDTVHVGGQHPACTAENGALDMMGNLLEWTSSGTLRGGYYLDSQSGGPGCFGATLGYDLQDWDYSTGFRCCADTL